MKEKQRIYIAGPLNGSGAVADNVRKACSVGSIVHGFGHTPFVPHINVLWHEHYPMAEEAWLSWDLEWLALCSWLVRLPGRSPGSDVEVATARGLGISVAFLPEDPALWFDYLWTIFGAV